MRVFDARQHRAADDSAELILFVWSHNAIEDVFRVEGAVAKKLPDIAMKCIRASLGDDVDDSAHRATVGRAVVVRLNFELLDRIDDWRDSIVPDEGIVGEAIKQKHVASIRLPIDR